MFLPRNKTFFFENEFENGNNYAVYILNTYFEGDFDQTLWNHYETDTETTNNFDMLFLYITVA